MFLSGGVIQEVECIKRDGNPDIGDCNKCSLTQIMSCEAKAAIIFEKNERETIGLEKID